VIGTIGLRVSSRWAAPVILPGWISVTIAIGTRRSD
jgi:hypothetical protein